MSNGVKTTIFSQEVETQVKVVREKPPKFSLEVEIQIKAIIVLENPPKFSRKGGAPGEC